ncbi:MAG: hypothetical protein ACFFB5_14995 [Promethearchaeota archaeon]
MTHSSTVPFVIGFSRQIYENIASTYPPAQGRMEPPPGWLGGIPVPV